MKYAAFAGGMLLLAVGNPTSALAAPISSNLSILVRAKVEERCGIQSARHDSPLMRIDQADSFTFPFTLDCNTPFRIAVRSRNGGLRLTTAAADIADLDGFAIEKNYQVGLTLATDNLASVDAGRCDSADLAEGGHCPFFGHPRDNSGFSPGADVTAINREGAIQVSWSGDENVGRRLAAGTYQDTLIIEVAPRL